MGPLDILRTQEASQIKHMENQRIQHLQEQGMKNFQTMVEHEHTKTKELTKSENPEYRYDAKEKGNNKYYSSDKKRKDKKEEEKKGKNGAKPQTGGSFDILI